MVWPPYGVIEKMQRTEKVLIPSGFARRNHLPLGTKGRLGCDAWKNMQAKGTPHRRTGEGFDGSYLRLLFAKQSLQ